jgi:hypothetical protein
MKLFQYGKRYGKREISISPTNLVFLKIIHYFG